MPWRRHLERASISLLLVVSKDQEMAPARNAIDAHAQDFGV